MGWGDNTYPGSVAPEQGGYDRVGYAWAQCASFCDEQIVDQLQKAPVYWGNASDWASRASAAGVPVDGTPRAGDVIQLPPGVSGASSFGHVACVRGVSPDGRNVFVGDYNWVAVGTYGQHWLPVAGANFIHVGPAPAPPPPPPPSGITWESFSGTVQVNDAHVRNGPGLGFAFMRDVYLGTPLGFDGFAYADAVWDPVANQWDHRWFHIDQAHDYGWVASALIDGNPPNSHP